VKDQQTERILLNGNTLHGSQSLNCVVGLNREACTEPTSYYHRNGPLGVSIAAVRHDRYALRIGVVGLGVGTIAAYCEPNDQLVFYEIDRNVVETADTKFKFLDVGRTRCAEVRIGIGDGRVLLRREEPGQFDLLVADAFSSDSVPVHLLTMQALEEFVDKLKPRGVLALHLSNRHFDLALPVKAAANRLGFRHVVVEDKGGTDRHSSEWLLVGRPSVWLEKLMNTLAAQPRFSINRLAVGLSVRPWTDQRHSLFEAFRRR
jgi:SAM-dependent methyltransferase